MRCKEEEMLEDYLEKRSMERGELLCDGFFVKVCGLRLYYYVG